ncbi:MAG: DUF805 domain-containing protein [Rhodobacteraceae bacterium]|nr:DUF805 domain-containing protein [Paracoccaceae bacterium]
MPDLKRNANLTPSVAWALFSPFGRLSRLPYWLGFGLTWVIIGLLVNMWLNGHEEPLTIDVVTVDNFMASNPLLPFVFLAMQWINLALIIKRCQDLGMTGFVALVAFVPLINLAAILVLGFMPGQKEANRFGPMSNTYFRRN